MINSAGERVREWCEDAAKFCYTSKKDARHALMGQLRSKSVRIYQCPDAPSHWHLTTQWKKDRS